jgi:hypothetical protein
MLLGQGSNRSASYHEIRLFVVLFIPLFLGLIALDVPNETAGCIFIGISIFDLIMSWDDEQVETAYCKKSRQHLLQSRNCICTSFACYSHLFVFLRYVPTI